MHYYPQHRKNALLLPSLEPRSVISCDLVGREIGPVQFILLQILLLYFENLHLSYSHFTLFTIWV